WSYLIAWPSSIIARSITSLAETRRCRGLGTRRIPFAWQFTGALRVEGFVTPRLWFSEKTRKPPEEREFQEFSRIGAMCASVSQRHLGFRPRKSKARAVGSYGKGTETA